VSILRQRGRDRIEARTRGESVPIDGLVRQIVAMAGEPIAHDTAVTRGETVLDLEVDGERYVLVRLASASATAQVSLTPREVEIARLVAKGYVNKTIAGILDISCYTVDTYMRRIFAKLSVTSRAAMVARLSVAGLLSAN
jgi:DNA-binding CsgD family transcriptional regulator